MNQFKNLCDCGQPATKMCDGKLDNGKTCDRYLCVNCAYVVGLSSNISPDGRRFAQTIDLCKSCFNTKDERDGYS